MGVNLFRLTYIFQVKVNSCCFVCSLQFGNIQVFQELSYLKSHNSISYHHLYDEPKRKTPILLLGKKPPFTFLEVLLTCFFCVLMCRPVSSLIIIFWTCILPEWSFFQPVPKRLFSEEEIPQHMLLIINSNEVFLNLEFFRKGQSEIGIVIFN